MPAWHDQFTTPTEDALDAGVAPAHAPAWASIRKQLAAQGHLSREVRWMGVPWRWTIVYADGPREVAYLVPDPSRPLLATPVTLDRIGETDPKKLARTVREGLSRARVVDRIAWAEWEVTSQAAASDLGKFVAWLEREPATA